MILNLTQHRASTEQIAAGVVDLNEPERAALTEMLTFDDLPTRQEIEARANAVADLALTNNLAGDDDEDPHPLQAMIGGAPFLMSALEAELLDRGIQPVYAFSRRESEEQTMPDGSVRKVNVFRHVGFVDGQ